MTMGERIRSRRTELGLSQEDLAWQTGYRDKKEVKRDDGQSQTNNAPAARRGSGAYEGIK